MTMLSATVQRQRLRAVLAGDACVSPASVYDARALSARVAAAAGFEIGLLSGSVAAAAALAAPDMQVLTLTELADQIRRITRASSLSLMVDADDGYGNALNVMRAVEEIEHAGASGMSIEDLALPAHFGDPETEALVSTEEMVGKLRAAVAARRDPSFVITGRTAAVRAEGTEGIVRRAKAYAATGVDALFVVGTGRLDQIRAVHDATPLPIIVGATAAVLDRGALAAAGVRVMLQGHFAVAAAVKALAETYAHLHSGGSPAELKQHVASPDEMARATLADSYQAWQRDFMR